MKTTLLRAGELADQTTFFVGDLAYVPNQPAPIDSHEFLFRFTSAGSALL